MRSVLSRLQDCLWKEQQKKADKSATEDLHQTSDKKVSRFFPCLHVKKGFRFGVVD
jgi:hypothetical protein